MYLTARQYARHFLLNFSNVWCASIRIQDSCSVFTLVCSLSYMYAYYVIRTVPWKKYVMNNICEFKYTLHPSLYTLYMYVHCVVLHDMLVPSYVDNTWYT